jgi:hypothetical protein
MKLGRLISLCALSVALSLPALAQTATGKPKPQSGPEEAKPEPVIPGMTVERKTGDGLFGIEIKDGNFKLSFYDKDKKPVAGNYDRALLRWAVTYKRADERLMLNASSDGKFLTSSRIIRAPYNFLLFITLIGPEGSSDEVESETYAVNFRQ